MSVTICWRSTEKDKHFQTGTSDQLEVLHRVIGHLMDEKNVPTLRAMAAAAGKSGAFYEEVADVIESVGGIEVFGQW